MAKPKTQQKKTWMKEWMNVRINVRMNEWMFFGKPITVKTGKPADF